MPTGSLISIVMPIYNATPYLDEAVQSVLAQTCENWELIFVDDGSVDDTPNKIASYVAQDKRMHSTRHDNNLGLPSALNTGWRMMRGDYFTWLSDDDMFQPTALEEMVSFLEEHSEFDLVYTDYTLIDERGFTIGHQLAEDPELLGITNPIGVCHLRRRIVMEELQGYSENFFLVEDLDFWIRAFIAFEMCPLHKDLFFYRIHRSTLSSKYKKRIHSLHVKVIEWHKPDMYWMDADAWSRAYLRLAMRAFNQLHLIAAGRYLIKAISYSYSYVFRRLFTPSRMKDL